MDGKKEQNDVKKFDEVDNCCEEKDDKVEVQVVDLDATLVDEFVVNIVATFKIHSINCIVKRRWKRRKGNKQLLFQVSYAVS